MISFLNIQYLISPHISYFPSLKYYGGNLKSGVDPEHLPIIPGFDWPREDIGISLINVDGFEELYNGSLQNTKEAELIIKIITKILAKGYCSLSEIGLVTPYKGQKNLLQRAILVAKKKYPSIFGPSTDSEQEGFEDYGYTDNFFKEDGVDTKENGAANKIGCIELIDVEKPLDKDLIIFSTVRSNKDGKLGELNDPRMLNSILTKSRRGVIIIGNLKTMLNNSAWRDFVFWAQVEGLVLNYV